MPGQAFTCGDNPLVHTLAETCVMPGWLFPVAIAFAIGKLTSQMATVEASLVADAQAGACSTPSCPSKIIGKPVWAPAATSFQVENVLSKAGNPTGDISVLIAFTCTLVVTCDE